MTSNTDRVYRTVSGVVDSEEQSLLDGNESTGKAGTEGSVRLRFALNLLTIPVAALSGDDDTIVCADRF